MRAASKMATMHINKWIHNLNMQSTVSTLLLLKPPAPNSQDACLELHAYTSVATMATRRRPVTAMSW